MSFDFLLHYSKLLSERNAVFIYIGLVFVATLSMIVNNIFGFQSGAVLGVLLSSFILYFTNNPALWTTVGLASLVVIVLFLYLNQIENRDFMGEMDD
jgi:hypothetical protein